MIIIEYYIQLNCPSCGLVKNKLDEIVSNSTNTELDLYSISANQENLQRFQSFGNVSTPFIAVLNNDKLVQSYSGTNAFNAVHDDTLNTLLASINTSNSQGNGSEGNNGNGGSNGGSETGGMENTGNGNNQDIGNKKTLLTKVALALLAYALIKK